MFEDCFMRGVLAWVGGWMDGWMGGIGVDSW